MDLQSLLSLKECCQTADADTQASYLTRTWSRLEKPIDDKFHRFTWLITQRAYESAARMLIPEDYVMILISDAKSARAILDKEMISESQLFTDSGSEAETVALAICAEVLRIEVL